jgi:hypothetical protein
VLSLADGDMAGRTKPQKARRVVSACRAARRYFEQVSPANSCEGGSPAYQLRTKDPFWPSSKDSELAGKGEALAVKKGSLWSYGSGDRCL